MIEAVRKAMKSPWLMVWPIMIFSALCTIVVIVVLGFRSLNMDDIRADLKAASAQRERIEEHLKLIDRQNAESRKDRAKLHEAVKKVAEPDGE